MGRGESTGRPNAKPRNLIAEKKAAKQALVARPADAVPTAPRPAPKARVAPGQIVPPKRRGSSGAAVVARRMTIMPVQVLFADEYGNEQSMEVLVLLPPAPVPPRPQEARTVSHGAVH